MSNHKIYLSSPYMSKEGYELEFIRKAFETNWIAPLGENVDLFEIEVQSYLKSGKATALSSGTAAIHLGLKALGVGVNDKPGTIKAQNEIVICPSLTFSASANPVVYLGAQPVFIDSERKTWNMDPEALRCALEKYEGRVKAVVIVHLYGTVALMDDLLSICDQYGIPVLEDSAEALGSWYNAYYYWNHDSGKREWHEEPKKVFAGTAGDIGVFSFNGNKIITTSGGGMLLANDPKKADDTIKQVHFWSTQSREDTPWYQHEELGYNYRMSNVLAGIGRGQLKVLERHIEKKKVIFDFYRNNLEKKPFIEMMPVPSDQRSNLWLSCVLFKEHTPSKIIAGLAENNIEARHIWKPMHLQPYFSHCDLIYADESPYSEYVFSKGLCLPSDLNMTEEDMYRVVDVLKNI